MSVLLSSDALPQGLRVLLGGSFDPVHGAHAQLADAVQRTCRDAELIWIPAAQSPFKPEAPQVSAEDRRAMLHALLKERPGEQLDARELARPAPSYSLDTVRSLQEERPQRPLALAMGADTYAGITRWHGAAELLERVIVLVAPRPGLGQPQAELQGFDQARVHFLAMPPVELSSTSIRADLAQGRDPGRAALPLSVFQLIRQRGLYGWKD
jgi:nicotinate-nucleotide adenylyltransferase